VTSFEKPPVDINIANLTSAAATFGGQSLVIPIIKTEIDDAYAKFADFFPSTTVLT
jgi:hypothetical protein